MNVSLPYLNQNNFSALPPTTTILSAVVFRHNLFRFPDHFLSINSRMFQLSCHVMSCQVYSLQTLLNEGLGLFHMTIHHHHICSGRSPTGCSLFNGHLFSGDFMKSIPLANGKLYTIISVFCQQLTNLQCYFYLPPNINGWDPFAPVSAVTKKSFCIIACIICESTIKYSS